MFLAWSFGDWPGSMTVGSRYYRSETQGGPPTHPPLPYVPGSSSSGKQST